MRLNEEVCVGRNGGYGTGCGGRADRPGRGGCLVAEGFVNEEESFALNPLRDGEPEELLRTGVTVCFHCRLTWKCLTEKRSPPSGSVQGTETPYISFGKHHNFDYM